MALGEFLRVQVKWISRTAIAFVFASCSNPSFDSGSIEPGSVDSGLPGESNQALDEQKTLEERLSSSLESKSHELQLPFSRHSIRKDRFGLMAFGRHGGRYPEGYAGWILELAPLSPVVAPVDATVVDVQEDPDFPDRYALVLEVEGIGLRVALRYLSYKRSGLESGVRVRKGMRLGDASFLGEGMGYGIALDCLAGNPLRPVCPLPWFENDVQTFLREFNDSIPIEDRDPYEWDLCQPLTFDDVDPMIGVWYSEEGPEPFPTVVSLSPFDVVGGRRVIASGLGFDSSFGVFRANEELGVEILLDDGREFVGRFIGFELILENALVPGSLRRYVSLGDP